MDEGLIKFLILIIFLVVGAINRSNKKKKKSTIPPPLEEHRDDPDLKDILEEILGKKEAKSFPSPPIQKAPRVKPQPRPVQKLDTVEDAIDKYEGEGVSVTEASNLHPKTKKQKKSIKIIEEAGPDFDARQAFIYSEIFNRKY